MVVWCTTSQKCGTCCDKKEDGYKRYLACGSAPYNDRTGFGLTCDQAKDNYKKKAGANLSNTIKKVTPRCAGLKDETLRQCLSGVGSGKTTPKLPLSRPVSGPITPAHKGITPAKPRHPITPSTPTKSNPITPSTPTSDTPALPPSSTDQPEDFFANNGIFIIAALAIVVLLVVL